MSKANFREATKAAPCPICGRDHFCAQTDDGARWCSTPGATAPPGWVSLKNGIFRPEGDRRFGGNGRRPAPPPAGDSAPAEPTRPAVNWAAEGDRCRERVTVEAVEALAAELGVTADSLLAVGVGRAEADELAKWRAGFAGDGERPASAWVFPERNGSGSVTGLSLRGPDGRKGFAAGGRRGLIIPTGLHDTEGPVFVVEGASDTAALFTLGLPAVSRPSNNGGAEDIHRLLADRDLIVVGENDAKDGGAWPGRDGAKAVAEKLAELRGGPVQWSMPPKGSKDVRAWLRAKIDAGLNLGDCDACLEAGRELADALTLAAKAAAVPKRRRKSLAANLVELFRTLPKAELFHTPGSDPSPYARVPVGDHLETLPVLGTGFRRFLTARFYAASGRVPNADAIKDAVATLAGEAIHAAPELPVYVRVAPGADGAFWIDLADANRRCVHVTPQGWRIAASDDPDVPRFIRPRGLLPLPEPSSAGDLSNLRSLLNIDDDGWTLLAAWLAAAFRPVGPYPILVVSGEQGSAKSTLCRIVRGLADPNKAPLRAEPREPRDLVIAASNSHVLCFDNISSLPAWLSDGLCRLATGGGFATRELYTNDEETIFDSVRPIILNGIEDFASRADLLDRAVILRLAPIPEDRRKTEGELAAALASAAPLALGGLLDAVADGLGRAASVKLGRLPRMADFATWGVACERGLGLPEGAFLAAFDRGRADILDTAIEGSPIGPAVLRLLESGGGWRGTASELLAALNEQEDTTGTRRARGWPQTPRQCSGLLRRLAPQLRALGWDISTARVGRGRARIIEAVRAGISSSASSAPPATDKNAVFEGENAGSPGRAADDPADDRRGGCATSSAVSPHENGPGATENAGADHADHADDETHHLAELDEIIADAVFECDLADDPGPPAPPAGELFRNDDPRRYCA